MVLGSQFLTALRDKIYCLTDNLAEKAGIHMPSGFFLIEVIELVYELLNLICVLEFTL